MMTKLAAKGLQMRKWMTALILLACFLLGLEMYADIISNFEIDFRFLHKKIIH